MKRPVLWTIIASMAGSWAAGIYFDHIGLWWVGAAVAAMLIGPLLGWYTRAISVRVAAFRAGWAAAGRDNKRVDGS